MPEASHTPSNEATQKEEIKEFKPAPPEKYRVCGGYVIQTWFGGSQPTINVGKLPGGRKEHWPVEITLQLDAPPTTNNVMVTHFNSIQESRYGGNEAPFVHL
jgi:hypothetical protein